MTMCNQHILSHLLKEKKYIYKVYTALKRVISPPPCSNSFPLLFFRCFSLLLFPIPSPLRSFIPLYLVFFLSSPVVFCLGMLATLQLYSSMHFISIFISDFVTIYFLIYLGLFMHAVCETDSCIYQWNRVRS